MTTCAHPGGSERITPAGQVVDPAPVGSVAEAGSGVRPPQATDRTGSSSGAGSRPSGQCAGRPDSQASMPEVKHRAPRTIGSAVAGRRKATPLRSAHSQRPGEANIFSREWRANGGGTIRPHLPSPADANRVAARARLIHVPVEVHFSRKGATLSTLLCKCGHLIEVEDESLLLGHRKLEQAFAAHRRTA